jgi:hypothetical protein
MNRWIIIYILSLLPLFQLKGQEINKVSLTLQKLYTAILNADDDERIRLNDSVRIIIDNYVHSDSVLTHRFDNLRYLGQIDSPDGKIKLLTWNLPLRNGENRYYLYIIRENKKPLKNSVYKLEGSHRKEAARTDMTYSADDWYGALYYSVQPFRIRREKLYLLLGLDSDNINKSRKIIEVLGFSDNDEIVFGRDCLIRDGKKKYREVLEYSAEGLISLRLRTKKLIVFDHIDPFAMGHENDPEAFGAGSSFDGYTFRKGNWEFISDVDVRNVK